MWLQEEVDEVDGNMFSDIVTTVKSFIFVGHFILWVEQAINLRSERNIYSL